jgi:hypothetical protein
LRERFLDVTFGKLGGLITQLLFVLNY